MGIKISFEVQNFKAVRLIGKEVIFYPVKNCLNF